MLNTSLFSVLVHEQAKRYGDKTAMSYRDYEKNVWVPVSWNRFSEVVRKVSASLLALGVDVQENLAVFSQNMPECLYVDFGAYGVRAVTIPFYATSSESQVVYMVNDAEIRYVFVGEQYQYDIAFRSMPHCPTLQKLIIFDSSVVKNPQDTVSVYFEEFLQAGAGHEENEELKRRAAELRMDDLANILYTSGTTGASKGVMLSHAALCALVGVSSRIFPVLRDDVFLSVLPLSHTYECSIGMIYPFSMGARVVYLDRPPTASALMPALRAVRPSVMLIVPLIIEKIYRHQVLAKFNSNGFWRTLYKVGFLRRYLHRVAGKKLLKLFGGRLRFLGIGGAKLDGGAEKFLLEAKVPYAIGYGLTETAPLLAGAAPSQVRLGSTGPQAPGVQLRLENINPDTRQGEVVALTPSVMLGYFKNPEATKEVFTDDGWFRTGDLGEFDKDGWLYIKGRLKNMIVGPGGENIYPEDIETVLNSHVYIADSIVTEQEGRLVALVHFNRDEIEAMFDNWREEWETKKEAWEAKTEQLKKEIMDFVNAKVNRFSRISEVVEEKDDFAKTPTHKIKRFLYNRSKDNDKPQREQPAGKPETK